MISENFIIIHETMTNRMVFAYLKQNIREFVVYLWVV
jgi:hypothetical protein